MLPDLCVKQDHTDFVWANMNLRDVVIASPQSVWAMERLINMTSTPTGKPIGPLGKSLWPQLAEGNLAPPGLR